MAILNNQRIWIKIKSIVGDEFYQSSTVEEKELDEKSEEKALAKACKVADTLSNFQASCTCEKTIEVEINTGRNIDNPSIKVVECCPISAFELQNRLKNCF